MTKISPKVTKSFEYTAEQAITMLALTKMEPFTDSDWQAFSGCESKDPLIGYYEQDCTLVLDGGVLNVIHQDDLGGGQLFRIMEINK